MPMGEDLFDCVQGEIPIEDVFEAYYTCRRHKRSTLNALKFELDFEFNCVQLWREINNGTYQIGRSITFIVDHPVKREIFAADFRDRIVHHLIIQRLMPFFEHAFIDESYSCRVGKGCIRAVKDIYKKIEDMSEHWTKPCYVLKMDIQAFFMSIEKRKLYGLLEEFVRNCYTGTDKKLLLDLIKKVVLNSPQKNCIVKGCPKTLVGVKSYQKFV